MFCCRQSTAFTVTIKKSGYFNPGYPLYTAVCLHALLMDGTYHACSHATTQSVRKSITIIPGDNNKEKRAGTGCGRNNQ